MENSIGNLFDAATTAARENNSRQNKYRFTPQFSRFKLQFKLRNGTTSIPYHSYDIHRGKGGKNITDESIGYSKLLLLIDRKRDEYVCATIFANLTDDLRTYVNGRLNMCYDEIVFKHVRGQNPFANPLLKFREGRLDVDLIKKGIAV